MSVRLDGEAALLRDDCHVEDAETLTALLSSGAVLAVDIADCRKMHAAVLQALLAFTPDIVGEPADLFLRAWIVPMLKRNDPRSVSDRTNERRPPRGAGTDREQRGRPG